MLFKATIIKTLDCKITSVVESVSDKLAASEVVVKHFGEGSLFIPVGAQPQCGWHGPIHRNTGFGPLSEKVTVKVREMLRIEEAAVLDKVPSDFFDDELRYKGVTPNIHTRARYIYTKKEWLKNVVFKNLSEINIRRWRSRSNNTEYFSMRLVASLYNSEYVLHIKPTVGHGSVEDLVVQEGIIHNRLLVRDWLEIHNISVKDDKCLRKSEMFKSAI